MSSVKLVSNQKRKLPPCRAACPSDVNVQGYVALVQQGRFEEAVELIRKSMPFPAICGRICFSPCQDACSRKKIDQPVGIRYLKRLAADIEREQGRVKANPTTKLHNDKVAIIGAGPAGLAAAYELARLGYPVTIFERMSEPGGMMRYGIPDFRLRRYVVANEIAYIKDLGVTIKTGMEFGKNVTLDTLRKEGYKATFIAIGAQRSRKLDVPGEDFEGVFPAVEFLRHVALDRPIKVGARVAVVGGGNSAIDAARTSLMLNAKEVTVLYRRSRTEMPALPQEVEAAEAEGIKFHFLVAPKRIICENGKVKTVECLKLGLGEPDESGRRRPVPIQGTEHTYEIDTLIPAIGQMSETSCLPPAILDPKKQTIQTDPLTLETKIPGVFAGGDVVSGPASVIEAVGMGKRAAISIDLYLTGRDLRAEREVEIEEITWVKDWESLPRKPERYSTPHKDIGKQKVSFEEAEDFLANAKKTAMFEARRCLECGPCMECLRNEELCDTQKATIDKSLCTGCNLCAEVCPFGALKKDETEIMQIDDVLCKGCGICSSTCPEHAITTEQFACGKIMSAVTTALKEDSV